MNNYEEVDIADSLKKEYLAGIETLIRAREEDAAARRAESVKDIFGAPEKHREALCRTLGFPLTERKAEGLPAVTSTPLFEAEDFTAERMQFEILDGLKMAGLFFRARGRARPLAVIQHGGIGTPELIANFYGGTANYNDMLERVRTHGVHVFAPMLLLWNKETHPVPYNRDMIDTRLKRVGSSIAAVEIYGIMRALDYFEAQPFVSTIGMLGLSYGGFFTLYTAAVDTRIRAAVCASHFFSRDLLPTHDRSWKSDAYSFSDAEAAALIHPRSLSITVGEHDPLFPLSASMSELERLCALCDEGGVGTDWLHITVFDGNHEFPKEEDDIERFIAALEA